MHKSTSRRFVLDHGRLTLSLTLAIIFAVSFGRAGAQTNPSAMSPYKANQNATPALDSGVSVAFPQAMLLHFTDWPFLSNTDLLPPLGTLQRTNAGNTWSNIETAENTYNFASLNFKWTGTCSTAMLTDSSNNGWVPAADCYNANANITEGGNTKQAGNLMYTFLSTPTWASAGNSAGYWTVTSVAVSGCGSSTCTVTLGVSLPSGITLNASSSTHIFDVVVVSGLGSADLGLSLNGTETLTNVTGSGASTVVTFTEPVNYYSGTTEETRVDCTTSTCTQTGGAMTFNTAYWPSDVNSTTETCTYTVVNPSGEKGDCYFREFVTALMEQNCDVSSVPGTPLTGSCAIHYFEGWNEFAANGYWMGNYTQLARMMVDADHIIKTFCGDCYFIAGSVPAGGDGFHMYQYTGTDGSSIWSEALGQLLYDWNGQAVSLGYSSLVPDAISVHPYPSSQTASGTYPPMPETNVSYNDTTSTGCQTPNPPIGYVSPSVASPHPGNKCRDAMVTDLAELVNTTSTGVISEVNSALGSAVYSTSTPVWVTESGMDGYFTSDFGTTAASSAFVDPYDATKTALIDQAYIARQIILLAASGDAANIWYQADNTEFGALFIIPANNWYESTSYSVGAFIWDGKSIQKCTTAGTSGTTRPSFSQTLGGTTNDGGVVWTKEGTNWVASTSYAGGAVIWDGTHVQETHSGGISGTTAPSWNATQGATTTDGSITWEDVISNTNASGRTSIIPIPTPMGRAFSNVYKWFNSLGISFTGTSSTYSSWTHSHAYAIGATIFDGVMLQRATTAGTSNSTAPSWNDGMYNTTTDGGVTWVTVGTPKCYDSTTASAATVSFPRIRECPINEATGTPANTIGDIVWYAPVTLSSGAYVAGNPDPVPSPQPTISTPSGTTCEWNIQGGQALKTGDPTLSVYALPEILDQTNDGTSGKCHP